MKEEKKKNIIIIILLGVVIALGVLIVLLFTKKNMTNEEALNIVTTASNKIGYVSNGYPYCGENMIYDEEDVILDENNISTHTASKDYKSLSEMKEDLKKYMSNDMINKYIDDKNYIEKDSKLYCLSPHRGAILYDKEKSSYQVENISKDKITASGTLATHSEGEEYKSNVQIEISKTNDNWLITKYEVKK